MAVTTFAAITIGSSEISMKIYEFSQKKNIRQIDNICYPIDLGYESYTSGKLSHDSVNTVCEILGDFCKIMKGYQTSEYTAIATSAVREAANCRFILDRIKLVTGLNVSVISNSEQRYLCYQAIAIKEDGFNELLDEGTIILDIGAVSIQLSVYRNGMLNSTQNIKLGFLRLKEILTEIENSVSDYREILRELISNDLKTYEDLYINGDKINNIIVVSDNLYDFNKLLKENVSKPISSDEFCKIYDLLVTLTMRQLANKLGISSEYASLVVPVAMIIQQIIEHSKAKTLWFPGVKVNDGIAVQYAITKMKMPMKHDFTNDAITAAKNIAIKYKCNSAHNHNVETNALKIFDSINKLHGLGRRERELLQLAAILYNCGEFINMNDSLTNSHHIILETEIIGVSHKEREIIANIIDFDLDMLSNDSEAIKICKLSVILRLARAMDKSHAQKISNIKVEVKEKNLLISFKSDKDISIEKMFFDNEAKNFSMVYGIEPKLCQKK